MLLLTLPRNSYCRPRLVIALTATKGWADPQVGKAYARSLELCQQLGDSAQLSRALYGSWAFYTEVPKLQASLELARRLLILAEKMNDPPLIEEAHYALGFTLFFRGEIV